MNSDEQRKLDELSFGLKPETNERDGREIEPSKQGISNRPGDEDPDSGVDREPGEDRTETVDPS